MHSGMRNEQTTVRSKKVYANKRGNKVRFADTFVAGREKLKIIGSQKNCRFRTEKNIKV